MFEIFKKEMEMGNEQESCLLCNTQSWKTKFSSFHRNDCRTITLRIIYPILLDYSSIMN